MFWNLSSNVKRTVSHPGPAAAASGAATTGAPAVIGGPVAGCATGIGGGGYSKRGSSRKYYLNLNLKLFGSSQEYPGIQLFLGNCSSQSSTSKLRIVSHFLISARSS